MKATIGIIGSGSVGQTLAAGFAKHGYPVILGSNDAAKVRDLASKLSGIEFGSFAETAAKASVIILAVKGTAAEAVIKTLGSALDQKIVLDATNPIADQAPVNGVLSYFTSQNESLMERLQAMVPGASFVKAFSCVGAGLMVDPQLPGGKPTMFICGNSDTAKQTAGNLLTDLGWEFADMGGVQAARAIEPLAILWCIPGFKDNQWMHAFKLLRM